MVSKLGSIKIKTANARKSRGMEFLLKSTFFKNQNMKKRNRETIAVLLKVKNIPDIRTINIIILVFLEKTLYLTKINMQRKIFKATTLVFELNP